MNKYIFNIEGEKYNMEKLKNNESSEKLNYGIDDKPKILIQILLGLQHIFAAFGGIIVVPIVISAALKFDAKTSTAFISSAILMAGIATFIQSKKIGPVGAKVACVMGTDFTFVAPAIAVGSKYGLPGILGATILGGVFVIILSFFIKPLMKLFPPIVTGTVVTLIGLTLIPVAMDWAAGGVGSKDYGSLKNIGISLVIMMITLLINHYGKGLISSASILIGMVVGYLICIPLGMVNFASVGSASLISLPQILAHGVNFRLDAVLPFIPAYLVSTIATVGCLKAIGEVSKVKLDDKRIGAGVLSDGASSMLAGFFGAMPNTSFSQNIGLLSLTKVASRYVTMMAGIILALLGLLPKVAALIYIMPQPVLGGVGIVMFGTVAAAGIQTLGRVKISNRNLLIMATSIGLGLGVTFRPDFLAKLPDALKMIFSSGISTGTIVALLLNLILKEDKK